MRAARRFRHARSLRLVAAVAAVALACLGVLAVPATSQAAGSDPCDIYAAAGTPCVAAYSTVRALYAAYDGPLYQVKRASDGSTANVGLLSAGGYGNATEQDVFCAHTNCVITELYDQSGRGNNLTIEGPGGAAGQDVGANAAALPVTVGGDKEYGLYINGQTGYRDNSTSGIAVNGEPEGMYMVASGTHVNSGCCFDFGNAETNTHDNGAAHMDAVNLTTYCEFSPCSGSGPWVEADMENGQYMGGDGSNPNDTSSNSDFVTAVLKNNGQTTFELRGGNAQSGGLSTYWDGALPSGYAPMRQEGAIVLGTGGDNSNASVGSFFEGVMTSGFPTDAADNAVQANITSVGYSGASDGAPAPAGTIAAPAASASTSSATTPGPTARWWTCGTASPTPSISTGRTTPTTRSAPSAAASTSTATAPPSAPRWSCGTATASAARTGCSNPTARCAIPSRGCASTIPAATPPTARCCRSTPATGPRPRCSRSTAAA